VLACRYGSRYRQAPSRPDHPAGFAPELMLVKARLRAGLQRWPDGRRRGASRDWRPAGLSRCKARDLLSPAAVVPAGSAGLIDRGAGRLGGSGDGFGGYPGARTGEGGVEVAGGVGWGCRADWCRWLGARVGGRQMPDRVFVFVRGRWRARVVGRALLRRARRGLGRGRTGGEAGSGPRFV
jgi:hypothetical protein